MVKNKDWKEKFGEAFAILFLYLIWAVATVIAVFIVVAVLVFIVWPVLVWLYHNGLSGIWDFITMIGSALWHGAN